MEKGGRRERRRGEGRGGERRKDIVNSTLEFRGIIEFVDFRSTIVNWTCYRIVNFQVFFPLHYVLTSFRGKFIKMLERIIIVFIRNKFNDYKYYWKKYFIIPKIISFGVELRLINTQYVAIIFREDYNSFETKEKIY